MSLSEAETSVDSSRVRDGKVPKPDDERKLFVGQLSSEISKEDLEKYFGQFGTIEDVTIKYDVPGGRARGFAFILFDQKESIDKVLHVPTHFINQCQIDPKQAHRRPPVTNPVKKIFIGQLPTDFVEDDLSEYFSQFGLVETIELPMDRGRSVRRPFGFVSFSSEKTAEEVLRQQRHSINGTSIEVRPAKPRPNEHQHHQQQQPLHIPQQQQQQYSYGEYFLPPHHLSTFTAPQSMINFHPNSYYTQTMNNTHYNGQQILEQWGQGTSNGAATYWSTATHDPRANGATNSLGQWSTGTNNALTANNHLYSSVGNSSSSSSSTYPHYSTGNIYSTDLPSPPPPSSADPSSNYDPNLFYAPAAGGGVPSFYPNVYSQAYYPSSQPPTVDQSQPSTSSNAGQEKTYSHVSR